METEDQRDALPAGVQLQGWLTGRPQFPEGLDTGALSRWANQAADPHRLLDGVGGEGLEDLWIPPTRPQRAGDDEP